MATQATPRPWATMISIEREPADYAYAFRAVNQHDALAEALSATLPYLARTAEEYNCWEEVTRAEAALRKAHALVLEA